MPRAAPVRRLSARSRAACCHAFILGAAFFSLERAAFSLANSAREIAAADILTRAERVIEGWMSVFRGGGGSDESRLT